MIAFLGCRRSTCSFNHRFPATDFSLGAWLAPRLLRSVRLSSSQGAVFFAEVQSHCIPSAGYSGPCSHGAEAEVVPPIPKVLYQCHGRTYTHLHWRSSCGVRFVDSMDTSQQKYKSSPIQGNKHNVQNTPKIISSAKPTAFTQRKPEQAAFFRNVCATVL